MSKHERPTRAQHWFMGAWLYGIRGRFLKIGRVAGRHYPKSHAVHRAFNQMEKAWHDLRAALESSLSKEDFHLNLYRRGSLTDTDHSGPDIAESEVEYRWPEEAAMFLEMSVEELMQRAKAGEIPYVNPSHEPLFSPDDLRSWLKENKPEALERRREMNKKMWRRLEEVMGSNDGETG